MRKVCLLALMMVTTLLQAQTMKEVFIDMPDSLCILLTKNNRADFADFLESNMRAQVKNKFDKVSEMKVLTKDYLLLETTSSSTLQMKLLPVSDSVKVVCVIETYKGPAADSRIFFYSTEWEELPIKDYLFEPNFKSFLLSADSIDVERREIALAKVDMNLMKADLSPDAYTLSFLDTTLDYLDKESAEELRPFISSNPIIYHWRDGKFIKE